MEEYKIIRIRMILVKLLQENNQGKTIKEGDKIVTDSFNEIQDIFNTNNLGDALDSLISVVEKKGGHQWRSKINAIGFVKSIADEH